MENATNTLDITWYGLWNGQGWLRDSDGRYFWGPHSVMAAQAEELSNEPLMSWEKGPRTTIEARPFPDPTHERLDELEVAGRMAAATITHSFNSALTQGGGPSTEPLASIVSNALAKQTSTPDNS